MFSRMFKWKEFRIPFKFDLWEIFMAWPGEIESFAGQGSNLGPHTRGVKGVVF